MTQDLLLKIMQYEQQLHRLQTRRQKAAIEKLLHRVFSRLADQESDTTDNRSSVRY